MAYINNRTGGFNGPTVGGLGKTINTGKVEKVSTGVRNDLKNQLANYRQQVQDYYNGLGGGNAGNSAATNSGYSGPSAWDLLKAQWDNWKKAQDDAINKRFEQSVLEAREAGRDQQDRDNRAYKLTERSLQNRYGISAFPNNPDTIANTKGKGTSVFGRGMTNMLLNRTNWNNRTSDNARALRNSINNLTIEKDNNLANVGLQYANALASKSV